MKGQERCFCVCYVLVCENLIMCIDLGLSFMLHGRHSYKYVERMERIRCEEETGDGEHE
jgi:hypothetical protein